MKLNRWFVVGIVAFLVLMFIIELRLPKNFSWEPTFRSADKQPFGCCLFDSLMQATMPQGYSVTDSSLYQLTQDTTRRGILVVADELELTEVDMESIFKMTARGSHVMLVSHSLCDKMCDTLAITMLGYGKSFDLQNHIKYNKYRDEITWESDTLGYVPCDYAVYGPLCTRRFRFVYDDNDSIDTEVNRSIDAQATYRGDYISATFPMGKGYITFACVPLLFTNYAVVDQTKDEERKTRYEVKSDDDEKRETRKIEQRVRTVEFPLRLLSLMKDLPVIRTEAYCPKFDETEQSPLRYLISQPPLRWALYLAMTGALLYLVFAGRRRQRVIPIEKEPENHSLEFIHLVGSLYYHSKERRSLVRRKWTYFAEELRRTIHVDVTDASEDDVNLTTLARLTATDEMEIRDLILRLRQLATDDDEPEISRKEMKRYIDQMNWIIKNI